MKHYSEDELLAFLDAEIDGAERARIRAHFGECPSCAGYIERWHARRELLQGDFRARPDFTAQVLRRIDKAAEKPTTSFSWRDILFDQLLPGLSLAFGIALLALQAQKSQQADTKAVLFSYFSDKEVNQIVADEEFEASSLLGLRQEQE